MALVAHCLPAATACPAFRRSGSLSRAERVRCLCRCRSAGGGWKRCVGVSWHAALRRVRTAPEGVAGREPPAADAAWSCVADGVRSAEAARRPCATVLPGASTERRAQGRLARQVASGVWTQEVTVTCPTRFGGCSRGVAGAAPRRAFAWRVMWDVPKFPWALLPAVCHVAEAI